MSTFGFGFQNEELIAPGYAERSWFSPAMSSAAQAALQFLKLEASQWRELL